MSSKCILIVEDNPINLKLIKTILDIEGYTTYALSDGKKLFKFLSYYSIDLILMDIQLPGLNGKELMKQVKSNKKYKNIIIIAITAYAMKDDRENMLTLGFDEYISKPINISSFSLFIHRLIQRKSYMKHNL